MSKLTRYDIQKLEDYWINLSKYKKELKFREWELLNPHQAEEQVGSRSGKISDTTGNRALLLVSDGRYQSLEKIIKAIEKVYNNSDDDMKVIIQMRYWDKDNNCYEWQHIGDQLYMSVQRVLRKRNIILDQTASELNWV